MRTTAKTRRKSLLAPADDLAIGRWYCVHGVRGDPDQVWPVFGQAFNIKAVNLPFIVGEVASDPSQPVTLDVRRLDLMPVTEEYAEAQRPQTAELPESTEARQLVGAWYGGELSEQWAVARLPLERRLNPVPACPK